MTSETDPNTAGVQYNRWNEDNINLNVAGTVITGHMYYMTCSAYQRLYNRVCTGTLGVAIKVAGALAALVAVYILGYLIGYYAHKC
uniref:Small integral membrane protein 1 n=1 Tax=Oncorhynchus mykiss TaxID=8022 RepID=A0A8K9XAB6_ONCMY